jgi:hypothetical protein
MPGIMADHDCEGQFAVLRALLESDDYADFWQSLNFEFVDFEELELPEMASDAVLWRTCQEHDVVLVTGNRHADSADSLEATIRTANDANCLPVLTIADTQRLMESKRYAIRVVERMLDYLMDLERYRGTGRLYVP